MSVEETRQKMVEMAAPVSSLTSGMSGAYSCRVGDRMVISPTGVRYERLEPDMFPVVDLETGTVHGDYQPSSECGMLQLLHRDCGAGAVVHVHSPWASTVAVLGEPLPIVHYAAVMAGPSVPVVDYTTYGTRELARLVRDQLEDQETKACLLENHGQVVYGDDLEEAYQIAEAIEFTARVYGQARSMGEPRELTDSDIHSVQQKFRNYGQEDRVDEDD